MRRFRFNADARVRPQAAVAEPPSEPDEARADNGKATGIAVAAAPAQHLGNGGLELLTEDELAARFHRTTGTLRRWRKAGTGPPYIPVGRDICYRPAAVEAWLASRERASGHPDTARTRRRR